MTVPFMRALVENDLDAAAREIGATVPATLSDDLQDFLRYRLAQLEVDPSILQWLGRAMSSPGNTHVPRSISRLSARLYELAVLASSSA